MSVQTNGAGVLLVDLGQGHNLAEDAQSVTQLVEQRAGCDVIMDFSQVTLLGSSQLACLLRLRKLVQGYGRRLVLCNIGRLAMGVFCVTGLDAVFEMAADQAAAAATVQAAVQV